MNDLSSLLYATPSFAEGIARIFDFGDTLTEYNRAGSGEQADFLALRADWRAVAADLRAATAAELERDSLGQQPSSK